jgi:hypothetical protein
MGGCSSLWFANSKTAENRSSVCVCVAIGRRPERAKRG